MVACLGESELDDKETLKYSSITISTNKVMTCCGLDDQSKRSKIKIFSTIYGAALAGSYPVSSVDTFLIL
jgi:hypothetical protein